MSSFSPLFHPLAVISSLFLLIALSKSAVALAELNTAERGGWIFGLPSDRCSRDVESWGMREVQVMAKVKGDKSGEHETPFSSSILALPIERCRRGLGLRGGGSWREGGMLREWEKAMKGEMEEEREEATQTRDLEGERNRFKGEGGVEHYNELSAHTQSCGEDSGREDGRGGRGGGGSGSAWSCGDEKKREEGGSGGRERRREEERHSLILPSFLLPPSSSLLLLSSFRPLTLRGGGGNWMEKVTKDVGTLIVLRARYAMPGTEIFYRVLKFAIVLRIRAAMSGTQSSAVRACYVVSGTDA
eukprot:2032544-Rhodomonas_salina.1